MWPGPDSILRRAAPSKDADAAVAKATLLAFPSIFSERGEGPDGHWRGGKVWKKGSNHPASRTNHPDADLSPAPCKGPPPTPPMIVVSRLCSVNSLPQCGNCLCCERAEIVGRMHSACLAPSGPTRCQWERQISLGKLSRKFLQPLI